MHWLHAESSDAERHDAERTRQVSTVRSISEPWTSLLHHAFLWGPRPYIVSCRCAFRCNATEVVAFKSNSALQNISHTQGSLCMQALKIAFEAPITASPSAYVRAVRQGDSTRLQHALRNLVAGTKTRVKSGGADAGL